MTLRILMRRRRVLSAAGLFAAACLLGAGGAEAHAIIVGAKPAVNAKVPEGPLDILLQYNSRIDVSLSRLSLTDPAGKSSVLEIAGGNKPGLLTAKASLNAPGQWLLRWQVLSIDGHVTRGEIPFTVEAKTAP
jgi:methionine-rich copper-binding protein CopC